jgi:hypothetical protein
MPDVAAFLGAGLVVVPRQGADDDVFGAQRAAAQARLDRLAYASAAFGS